MNMKIRGMEVGSVQTSVTQGKVGASSYSNSLQGTYETVAHIDIDINY
jgi:hypothetical protein